MKSWSRTHKVETDIFVVFIKRGVVKGKKGPYQDFQFLGFLVAALSPSGGLRVVEVEVEGGSLDDDEEANPSLLIINNPDFLSTIVHANIYFWFISRIVSNNSKRLWLQIKISLLISRIIFAFTGTYSLVSVLVLPLPLYYQYLDLSRPQPAYTHSTSTSHYCTHPSLLLTYCPMGTSSEPNYSPLPTVLLHAEVMLGIFAFFLHGFDAPPDGYF